MPEPTPKPKPGAKGKLGGLPWWAWVAAAAVGLAVGYFLLRPGSEAAEEGGASSSGGQQQGGGGGSSGGGSGGGGTTPGKEDPAKEKPTEPGEEPVHHRPTFGNGHGGGGDGDDGGEDPGEEPFGGWDPHHPQLELLFPVIDPDQEEHPHFYPEITPDPGPGPPIFVPGENPVPGEGPRAE